MQFRDAGYGYDVFGFSPKWLDVTSKVMKPVYEHYFRVKSYGFENVPMEGPAILAGNHSGTIPIDGMMLSLDVLFKSDFKRNPRATIDYFVAGLPFVGTLFSRVGAIIGSRGNFRYCLEQGDLIVVFPEGEPGVSKPFSKRYQLQKWRVGHVEFAIRYRSPVVPVAIIGAEEQMPLMGRIPIKLFGSPHIPVPASPFPLPVRYHIHYGEPIHLQKEYEPSDANDPAILREASERVKVEVEKLVARGLEMREGVFV